jgi:hypothetical protein
MFRWSFDAEINNGIRPAAQRRGPMLRRGKTPRVALAGQESVLVGMVSGVVAVGVAVERSMGFAIVMTVARVGGLQVGMCRALSHAEGEGRWKGSQYQTHRNSSHRQPSQGGPRKDL